MMLKGKQIERTYWMNGGEISRWQVRVNEEAEVSGKIILGGERASDIIFLEPAGYKQLEEKGRYAVSVRDNAGNSRRTEYEVKEYEDNGVETKD